MVCPGKTDGLKRFTFRLVGILLAGVVFVLLPQRLPAQEEGRILTLKESIQLALDRNLEVQVAKEEITFARERRKEARTGFLPKFQADYNYRRPGETKATIGGVKFKNEDQNQYNFTGTVAANTPIMMPDMIRKDAIYCATRFSITRHPANTTMGVKKAVSRMNSTEMPSTPR